MSEAPKTPAKADKAPPKSARRRAREFAVQGVYEWLLNRNVSSASLHVRSIDAFPKCDTAHFQALLDGIMAQEASLTESFTPFLDRPVAELSPVELATLLVGSFELHHCLDIPYKVVINEAVELAKAFGSDNSGKFVNGVLGTAYRTLVEGAENGSTTVR